VSIKESISSLFSGNTTRATRSMS